MSNRRYKVNEHPIYDRTYYNAKINSGILNRRANTTEALALWTPEGRAALLRQLEGTVNGQYKNAAGKMVDCQLKQAEEMVAAIDQQFKVMCDQVQRSGKYPPTEMPKEMVEDKLRIEARLDLLKDEIDALKTLVLKDQDQTREVTTDQVLRRGPIGATQGADPPREVDGQPVKYDPEAGTFVIDCKQSPYHGMRLPDYFVHVVKPWHEARHQAHRAAWQKCVDLNSSEGDRQSAWKEANAILRSRSAVPWPVRPEIK